MGWLFSSEHFENQASRLPRVLKSLFGSPIPSILVAMGLASFFNSWALLISLILLSFFFAVYMTCDLASQQREFKAFRLGGDILLGIWQIYSLILIMDLDNLQSLSSQHWTLLFTPLFLYSLSYSLDLFPSMGRITRGWIIAASVLWVSFSFGLFKTAGVNEWFLINNDLQISLLGIPLLVFLAQCFNTGDDLSWQKKTIYLSLMVLFSYSVFLWPEIRLWLILCITWIVLMLASRHRMFVISAMAVLAVSLFFFLSPSHVASAVQIENALSESTRIVLLEQAKVIENNLWFGQFNLVQMSGIEGNSYLTLLSNFGLFGFVLYFLFNFSVLYQATASLKLVPRIFSWQSIMLNSAFHFLIVFHISGLFLNTFSSSAFTFLWIFSCTLIIVTTEIYARGFVPDDRCL